MIPRKGFLKVQIKFGVCAISGASNQQREALGVSDLATSVSDFSEHAIPFGE